jgi:SAM-dependent methyltransferase
MPETPTRPPARDPASFRDPAGHVFLHEGRYHRQVNAVYREHYELLKQSGLYARLVGEGLLVEHQELPEPLALPREGVPYKTLLPRQLPWISYPYEWCFSSLRQAALATLRIQREALDHGMSLKDASAFNLTLDGCRPVFLDSLSFERYREGEPWVAYGQFCRHFLAPLAIAAYAGTPLRGLQLQHIDGVPLDVASRLLPKRTRLRPAVLFHLHLHAAAVRRDRGPRKQGAGGGGRQMSLTALRGLVSSLEGAVGRLRLPARSSGWTDYYDTSSYSARDMEEKERLVGEALRELAGAGGGRVLDLGANTGRFSRLAASLGLDVLASDSDDAVVERLEGSLAGAERERIVPLVVDLTNPAPACGWAHVERRSFAERGRGDLGLALALIHHLVIHYGIPLGKVAAYFADLAPEWVIEFVPKGDPQVDRLLAHREDIFDDYTRQGFEAAFAERFHLGEAQPVGESGRLLYRMRVR